MTMSTRIAAVAALIALAAACGSSEPAPRSTPPAAPPPAQPAEPAEPAAAEPTEAAPSFATMSEQEQQAYLMDLGQRVYTTGGTGGVPCVTCHQAEGQGMPPTFPPLANVGAEAMGDCVTHAGYVVHGLRGEIVVAGVTYNNVMPAQANLSDEEIAAVISYERNSWGNNFGFCRPEDVATARTSPAPTFPGQQAQ